MLVKKFRGQCIFSHLEGQESLPSKLYSKAVRSGFFRQEHFIRRAAEDYIIDSRERTPVKHFDLNIPKNRMKFGKRKKVK